MVDHSIRTVTSPSIRLASSNSVRLTFWPVSAFSITIALNFATLALPAGVMPPRWAFHAHHLRCLRAVPQYAVGGYWLIRPVDAATPRRLSASDEAPVAPRSAG